MWIRWLHAVYMSTVRMVVATLSSSVSETVDGMSVGHGAGEADRAADDFARLVRLDVTAAVTIGTESRCGEKASAGTDP